MVCYDKGKEYALNAVWKDTMDGQPVRKVCMGQDEIGIMRDSD